MNTFKLLFFRMLTVPGFQFWTVMLAGFLFVIQAMALGFLDIGTWSLYLVNRGFLNISLDFLGISVLMSWTGYQTLVLTRRKGYGSVFITGVLILILIGLIFGAVSSKSVFFDLLLVGRYVVFFLLPICFWTVVNRFIPLRLDSLKFVFILCAELFGFSLAGWVVLLTEMSSSTVLICSVFLFLLSFSVLVLLSKLNKIPPETFVQKTGEVQDWTEQKMVYGIFIISFLFMLGRCLLEYNFMRSLYSLFSPLEYIRQIAFLWGCFGSFGILLIVTFFKIRFLYSALLGVNLAALGFVIVGVGLLFQTYWAILIGVLIFLIFSHIYLESFLQLLVRILAVGKVPSIRKKRLVWIQPAGFMAGALFIEYLYPLPYMAVLLIVVGILLIILLAFVTETYSVILTNIFRMKVWRNGRIMIASRHVLDLVQKGLKSEDPDEVIYFLKILELSKRGDYEKYILKTLKHPHEEARLFALDRLVRSYDADRYLPLLESILKKDSSTRVRQNALMSLIVLTEQVSGSKSIEKYISFLDSRHLRVGAIKGFLKVGGNQALLAMDGLQKLVFSKRLADNKAALDIMTEVPNPGLVRLLIPLLKRSDSVLVRRALLAAGALKNPQLLPFIFKELDDPETQEEALIALKKFGKQAFPSIERILNNPNTPLLKQKILVLFLTRLSSGEGKQILLRSLQSSSQKLRKLIIQGMIDSGIFWVHPQKGKLLSGVLRKDFRRIDWMMTFAHRYRQAPSHEMEDAFSFLLRAVKSDILETRILIFFELLLLKDHPVYVKAIRILLTDQYDKYPAALGILEDMLPRSLFQKINTIAFLPVEEQKEIVSAPLSIEKIAFDIAGLLVRVPFVPSPWIKATALYCLRKLDCEESLDAVKQVLSKEKNPVVLEAALWAYARLEKDPDKRHQTVLNLPTSLLVAQSLDEILVQ